MWQTDNWTANFIISGLRSLFGMIDSAIYSILVVVYEVFFNVASAHILEGDTIKAFFGRIQLILGIFVLFKLAINLINVIINPDQLGDNKSGQGFTQIVVRVVISLLMLVAIMPLNIPGDIKEGSYEANLNANGLLFGTLYEFQDRILEQNTLAKLIVGSTKSSNTEEGQSMKQIGQQLSTFILKGFIRINLQYGKEDEYESANWMCPNSEDDVKEYLKDSTPGAILDKVTLKCKNDGKKRFVFTYPTPITTIVGIIFVIIMVGFVIDVAIRAFKLAVLRLIAPIPIISYIDPKSAKDGAFASYMKTLFSTYIGLFLNLAVIFFVLFVVQDIMVNGLDINHADGMIGAVSWIFIILGLLYFAKQAPKFITNALGIKSVGGFGVGLSGALGFIGGTVAGGGLSGAMTAAMTAANTANEAAAQGKAAPNAYSTGRDLIEKMKTGDDKAVGGILNKAQRNMMLHSKRSIGARELQRRFGITTAESNRAKNLMFQANDLASNMANMRSDIGLRKNGDLSSYATRDSTGAVERDAAGNLLIDASSNNGRLLRDFVNTHSSDSVVRGWLSGTVDDATMMNYMVNTTQTEAQKQKKTYEDSEKLLNKYGNDVTLEQKYGSSKYAARVRNTVAHGLQSNRVTRRSGERMENPNIGNGIWQRYFNDQKRSPGDQEFRKYEDKDKKWDDRTKA